MPLFLRSTALWALLLLFVGFTLGFGVFRDAAGGVLLDGLSDLDDILVLLNGMTPSEKSAHFYITLFLDMPYPLIYGCLFAATAIRFSGFSLLAIPAALVIPVDIAENTIQLLALSGFEDYLAAKQYLTPLKFALFALAGIIAVGAVAYHLFRRVTGRTNTN